MTKLYTARLEIVVACRAARCLLHINQTWKDSDSPSHTALAEGIVDGLLENGRLTAEQVLEFTAVSTNTCKLILSVMLAFTLADMYECCWKVRRGRHRQKCHQKGALPADQQALC